jgi:RNA polymerase sigma-70 factor (ECF subfamily)
MDDASNSVVASRKEQEVTPAVIDACRRGDREAFGLLYEAYKDRVYSVALYFFRGDAAAAADVTQQVFLKLMDTIGQFKGHADFSTWLYRFVVNACVDRTRSAWRHLTPTEPAALDRHPGSSSPELELATRERARAVQTALAGLTPPVRMAILLRYFEDLSYAEMAKALNCSPGTVASRLSRGHELLARKLAHLVRPRAPEAT